MQCNNSKHLDRTENKILHAPLVTLVRRVNMGCIPTIVEELQKIIFFPTMYVHCVYPPMSKIPK